MFSASALTLALCARHAKSRTPIVQAVWPASAATPAPTAEEPLPLSPVNVPNANADGAALEALFAIVQRGEPRLRSAALSDIAHIGGDRAREFLARRFDQAIDAEVFELANALATLGDAPARALLKHSAHSARAVTRDAAFSALSSLDTEDVREFMLQALADVEPASAIGYFVDYREPRALPALTRLAQSADPSQQRMAIDALFAQGESAERALLQLLRQDDALCDAVLQGQPTTSVSRQALRRVSIERLRAGALTNGPVFDFLQQDSSREGREALVQAARDEASSQSALNALSARGDIASLRALEDLAKDPEPAIARRAACTLLSHSDSRSRPYLLRLNRERLKGASRDALLRINAAGTRPI